MTDVCVTLENQSHPAKPPQRTCYYGRLVAIDVEPYAAEHPLRALARAIAALAEHHEASSQAHAVVQNCCDHLSAMARAHEANAHIDAMQRIK